MNLALGIVFLWLGAACWYLASHPLEGSSPFAAYRTLLTKVSESGG